MTRPCPRSRRFPRTPPRRCTPGGGSAGCTLTLGPARRSPVAWGPQGRRLRWCAWVRGRPPLVAAPRWWRWPGGCSRQRSPCGCSWQPPALPWPCSRCCCWSRRRTSGSHRSLPSKHLDSSRQNLFLCACVRACVREGVGATDTATAHGERILRVDSTAAGPADSAGTPPKTRHMVARSPLQSLWHEHDPPVPALAQMPRNTSASMHARGWQCGLHADSWPRTTQACVFGAAGPSVALACVGPGLGTAGGSAAPPSAGGAHKTRAMPRPAQAAAIKLPRGARRRGMDPVRAARCTAGRRWWNSMAARRRGKESAGAGARWRAAADRPWPSSGPRERSEWWRCSRDAVLKPKLSGGSKSCSSLPGFGGSAACARRWRGRPGTSWPWALACGRVRGAAASQSG